ncbi:MAG: hypothetical protein ABW184_09910 [Sphingobium sp.]
MVFPVAAAIGAAGSIAGGVAGGKGAKKAAEIQAQSAREQIAATERNRDYQYNLNAPTIDRGERASDLYADFLGAGDNPEASADALASFRGSTGYQDLLREGLAAVNSNAYAKGMGRSGATLKALQDRGSSLADRSAQGWMGNLGTLISAGGQARGLVAGVGGDTVKATNAASQSAADAAGDAANYTASNWAKSLIGMGNAAASAYGSSYGSPSAGMGRAEKAPPIYSTPPYAGYGTYPYRA